MALRPIEKQYNNQLAVSPAGASRLTSKSMPDRRTLLICSCEDTMPLDAGAFERGCRGADIVSARQLCRAELERFRKLLASGEPITVGCTQEAPLFREIAAESASDVTFANIRESAGWSAEAEKAGPKMAALMAAAATVMPDVPFTRLESGGVALVYGRDERAVEASSLLKEHLDITALITRPDDLTPPRSSEFPIVKGSRARRVTLLHLSRNHRSSVVRFYDCPDHPPASPRTRRFH